MVEKIKNILLENLQGVNVDAPLDEQLDSIAFAQLITVIEKAFMITLYPNEMDIDNFRSIKTIERLLEKKIRARI